jgi:hypothetical protein
MTSWSTQRVIERRRHLRQTTAVLNKPGMPNIRQWFHTVCETCNMGDVTLCATSRDALLAAGITSVEVGLGGIVLCRSIYGRVHARPTTY